MDTFAFTVTLKKRESESLSPVIGMNSKLDHHRSIINCLSTFLLFVLEM